ncbi:hypothetical protein [Streptomyces sp. SID9124]|uniref:hypothetical protein n=1 Tax=Streptomyces sp. SID9124 TaxID=2706108 RepID=UPI0013E0E5D0|nr:hypothetical protein [Streptomyces sp. SID9124]NED12741.1 hypothetical protein [Streptomyces sp. SID9124]
MKVSVLRRGFVVTAAIAMVLGAPAVGAVAQTTGNEPARTAATAEDPSWDSAQRDPSWDTVDGDPSWDDTTPLSPPDPSWD